MLKDRMIAFAGIFGKRYSKKQKIRFLRYIQSSAQEKGVKMYLDEGEASGKSGCNVYLGPTQRAKTILAVPYDTPSRLWWPGFHYYPMDPERNARQESLVMALNFALAAVLLAAYWFAVFRRCFSAGGPIGGLALFGLLLVALLAVNLVLRWRWRWKFSTGCRTEVLRWRCSTTPARVWTATPVWPNTSADVPARRTS